MYSTLATMFLAEHAAETLAAARVAPRRAPARAFNYAHAQICVRACWQLLFSKLMKSSCLNLT